MLATPPPRTPRAPPSPKNPPSASGPRGRARADLPALACDRALGTVREPPVLWPKVTASTVHPCGVHAGCWEAQSALRPRSGRRGHGEGPWPAL